MSTATQTIRPGDHVHYDHPSWGPSYGRVLRGPTPHHRHGTAVLVQDLHPNGAREWWPVEGVWR